MPYARLLEIMQTIADAEVEEFKERYFFVLRQTFAFEAKEGETFKDYLERMNFDGNKQETNFDINEEKQKALSIAERIVAAERQVKKDGNIQAVRNN